MIATRTLTVTLALATSAVSTTATHAAQATYGSRAAAMSAMVLQIGDLPAGLRSGTRLLAAAPLTGGTFANLRQPGTIMLKYGWQAGYSAVYANPRSQTMISAGVSRFATSGGAHSALLYVDVAYPKALPKIARSAVHITRVAGVSDEATAIVLNAKPSMVSVMFRQGSYLGSVIVTGSVALPSVVSLARTADARVKSNS